jgi:hypothetical protein
MNVTIKIPQGLEQRLKELGKHVVEPTMVGIATSVQHEITSNKPPPPPKGKMRFKSDRQRKFVMAGIRNGTIDSPYRRGISPGSQRLNRSYKLIRAPHAVTLTNTASYMQYVIGNKQAKIHQQRWLTGEIAIKRVVQSGIIARIVAKAIRKYFK